MDNIVHDSYFLYTTNEKFYVEPRDGKGVLNECMTIDRASREIKVTSNGDIPSDATSQTIFGVVGIIRLVAGPYLIVITEREKKAEVMKHSIWRVVSFDLIPYSRTMLHLTEAQVQDNRVFVSMVWTVLQTDGFYFSTSYDLTHTLQRLQNTSPEFRQMALHERAEERFVWNFHVLKDIAMHPELSRYSLPIVHGFVGTRGCLINNHPFTLTLISRRSCFRAGVRFHTRGLDTQGHVANYVESEQILEYGSFICSFVQTRGSIPLFWSQTPNLRWQPWPCIKQENQVNGFRSHIESQLYNYGKQIIVNLVNQRGREKAVGMALEAVVNTSGIGDVKYVHFDFHKETKLTNFARVAVLIDRLLPDLEQFGFFCARDGGYASKFQSGVFRTNCMDCLDRTNVVQSLLSRKSLEFQLKALQIMNNEDTLASHPGFELLFKNLWADNGDYCSVQYAGTGALKADFTRTGVRTTMGLVNDLINASVRYYRNNFVDGFRQDAIDLFLGNFVVDEENQAKTPLRQEWDWRFAAIPLGVILALSMFVLCLVFDTELFFTIFWFFCATTLMGFIFYYGEEFVNKPKLKLE